MLVFSRASPHTTPTRRRFLHLAGLTCPSLAWFSPSWVQRVSSSSRVGQQAVPAKITVDVDARVSTIDRKIYGHFAEHFGRCIYGGIFEEGSSLSDEQGYRKDVLDVARQLRVPVLRWPGGNFAASYHWSDGIGPKDQRPRKFDPAWFAEESNHFGTDEYIAYCRKLGAEPYVCVNMGTGTIEEAAAWVEYCNGTTNTQYANLRRKYGNPEPYNVKYWGLGNEVWGDFNAGRKGAGEYARQALELAKMMKWVDPSIKLIACGSYAASDLDWDRQVLETLYDVADYISMHVYVGGDDYYGLLGSARLFEERIRALDGVIGAVLGKNRPPRFVFGFPPRKDRIQIAVDEWNIWYRVRNGRDRNVTSKQEERYNLRDALWTASILNLFQRSSSTVTMANLNQFVNVLAPIITSKEGLFLQSIYFPFRLYVEHCGNIALDTRTISPTFTTNSQAAVTYNARTMAENIVLPYLDAQATVDDDARFVSLAVVNRHRDQNIRTAIQVQGSPALGREGMVFEINGTSPEAENSFNRPENVTIKNRKESIFGKSFQYEFPAHSVSLLKMQLSSG
jgi:alpha-N-arabinofuranosidase